MSYQKELFEAVSTGNMDRVETLVLRPDAKTTINKVFDETGETILTEAARKGQYATIEFMLDPERGADPKVLNDNGQAPMHLAAFAGDERIVKILHQNGAPLTVLDQEGKAPVHWAARHSQKKVLEYLIENGADVNLKTSEGNTCLQESILSAKPDVVSMLIKTKGSDVHHKNNRGETLLYSAARAGREKLVEKLLSLGTNFNAVTNNGETILYESARLGKIKVVEYILNYIQKYEDDKDIVKIDDDFIDKQTTGGECEVNGVMVDSKGWAALHVAVGQGHYDIVKLLLERGARKDIKNADNLSPEDLCLAYKQKQILPLFAPPPKKKTVEETENTDVTDIKKKGKVSDDWRY